MLTVGRLSVICVTKKVNVDLKALNLDLIVTSTYSLAIVMLPLKPLIIVCPLTFGLFPKDRQASCEIIFIC